MLKKSALRRIMASTLALIIVTILYFFPSDKINNITTITTYVDTYKTPIYLINKDEYVVRTNIFTSKEKTEEKVKELINALTIGTENNEYIPKNFKAIIPKNTKILSLSLENNLLKINFSKEFLNIKKELEEKAIEAIIYTLTK